MIMCNSPICIHADTCKHSAGNKTGVPLTQRGAVPFCHECNHSYWRLQVSRNVRTCDACKIVKSLTSESVKIKNTR